MTETILAFGDSNTHGTPPMVSRDHHPRLDRRWPVVMAEILGCHLIEDGLPGRTACQLNVTSPDLHLDGPLGLRMALATHGPIDRLLIMLGTNDFQTKYGKTPAQVAAAIAGLLVIAHDPVIQMNHGGFSVVLICPPPTEETGTFVPELYQSTEKMQRFLPLLMELAAQWNVPCIDAGAHIHVDAADGTHFDAAAHETLGKIIAATLQ